MDCSTFSFDLHVLGAPPALILSRDQTLIVCCEFAKSPRLTQSTDEFFFTASNQIVKDLRSPHPELRKTGATAGLELVPATSAHSDARSRETCKLEKEPNRKAVFRPLRWPEASFVTVPYRGSKSFKPRSRSCDKHSEACDSSRSPTGDSFRISEFSRTMQGVFQKKEY